MVTSYTHMLKDKNLLIEVICPTSYFLICAFILVNDLKWIWTKLNLDFFEHELALFVASKQKWALINDLEFGALTIADAFNFIGNLWLISIHIISQPCKYIPLVKKEYLQLMIEIIILWPHYNIFELKIFFISMMIILKLLIPQFFLNDVFFVHVNFLGTILLVAAWVIIRVMVQVDNVDDVAVLGFNNGE